MPSLGHAVPLCLAILSGAVLWGPQEPRHDWQVLLGSFAQMTVTLRGAETVAPEYHIWGQVEGGGEQGLAVTEWPLTPSPDLRSCT